MKIVLAEDDIMLADFLEEALIDLGHEVCGVGGDVASTIALVRLHRPDIAILDMQLGAELGTDVANALANSDELGALGILYVTGGADLVRREARFGHACLSKPYTLSALQSSLLIVSDVAHGHPSSAVLPHGMRLLSEVRTD